MTVAKADVAGVSQAHAVLTVAEGKRLIAKAVARMPEVRHALAKGMVIICKGTTNTYVAEELLGESIAPGDFVIGNMLDYGNKGAGVWIGSPTAGTTGKIMPYVIARKAHLVISIGLEKQVAGLGAEIVGRINESVAEINKLPSMWLLRGHIVTEIEALGILAGVEAFQAAAGGVGGAEGASWLVWRGSESNVRKALEIATGLQGERPFAAKE